MAHLGVKMQLQDWQRYDLHRPANKKTVQTVFKPSVQKLFLLFLEVWNMIFRTMEMLVFNVLCRKKSCGRLVFLGCVPLLKHWADAADCLGIEQNVLGPSSSIPSATATILRNSIPKMQYQKANSAKFKHVGRTYTALHIRQFFTIDRIWSYTLKKWGHGFVASGCGLSRLHPQSSIVMKLVGLPSCRWRYSWHKPSLLSGCHSGTSQRNSLPAVDSATCLALRMSRKAPTVEKMMSWEPMEDVGLVASTFKLCQTETCNQFARQLTRCWPTGSSLPDPSGSKGSTKRSTKETSETTLVRHQRWS